MTKFLLHVHFDFPHYFLSFWNFLIQQVKYIISNLKIGSYVNENRRRVISVVFLCVIIVISRIYQTWNLRKRILLYIYIYIKYAQGL